MLWLLLALTSASPIQYGDDVQKALYDRPCPPNATTDTELEYCAYQAYRKADASLNRQWPQVLAGTPRNWRAALIRAQRAWLRKRDRTCLAVGEQWEGGTGRAAAEMQCLTDETEARIRQLSR